MVTLILVLAWSGFAALLLVVLFIVATVARMRRRINDLRREARLFPCPRCRTIQGDGAVFLADELWMRHVRTLRERYPDRRFRMIRNLDAVCTRCGARFKFERESATFSEVEIVLSFEKDAPSPN